MFWGALQNGNWGALTQSAGAAALEGGYRFTSVPTTPWFRGGWWRATGDNDPTDSKNNTFFQVLPTPRVYARLPFYNAMNSTDSFVQVVDKPYKTWDLRSDLHWLDLTSSHDLWYLGGGAFDNKVFGFTGRPANGHTSFASVADISSDWQATKNVAFNAYYGYGWGKSVVGAIYPNGQKHPARLRRDDLPLGYHLWSSEVEVRHGATHPAYKVGVRTPRDRSNSCSCFRQYGVHGIASAASRSIGPPSTTHFPKVPVFDPPKASRTCCSRSVSIPASPNFSPSSASVTLLSPVSMAPVSERASAATTSHPFGELLFFFQQHCACTRSVSTIRPPPHLTPGTRSEMRNLSKAPTLATASRSPIQP